MKPRFSEPRSRAIRAAIALGFRLLLLLLRLLHTGGGRHILCRRLLQCRLKWSAFETLITAVVVSSISSS